jgi:hypothetical protein
VRRVGEPFNPFKMFNGIIIPEPLAKYRGVSPGAKIAWGRLARYAGENGLCYPAVPTLAREIGISTTQARTYIRELRTKRLLAIEQRPGTSGLYKFLWHEAFAGEIGERRKTPPLRKTDRVPSQITDRVTLSEDRKAPLSENGQRRESPDKSHPHQESQIKEGQSSELNSTQQDVVYETLVDELVAMVKKRTNQGLTFQVLDRIKGSLELRGVTMFDFLTALSSQKLESIRSAPAFLTKFAREFHSANKFVVANVVKSETRSRTCELGICSGRGHGNLTKGTQIKFCECPIGQDLRTKFQKAEEWRGMGRASNPPPQDVVSSASTGRSSETSESRGKTQSGTWESG